MRASPEEMAQIIDVVFFFAVCIALMRIGYIRNDLREIKEILQNQSGQNKSAVKEPKKVHSFSWVMETLLWTLFGAVVVIVGVFAHHYWSR